MDRFQQGMVSSVLIGILLCVPAYPQAYCPLPKQGQKRNAGTQEGTRRAVVDLRRLSTNERSAVLGTLTAADLPLINEQLLRDSAFVKQLLSARPPLVLRDGAASLHAHRVLTKPIAGLKVISGLPVTDAEIRSVYGGNVDISEAVRAQMMRAKASLGKLPTLDVSGPIAAATLTEARRGSAPEALVILAHNDGSTLRFPDGSWLTLARLSEVLETSTRPTFVVSCDTVKAPGFNGITTAKRIDFQAAAEALTIAQHSTIYGNFVRTFASSYRSPEARARERLVAVMVVFGTVVVIIMMLGDDDDL